MSDRVIRQRKWIYLRYRYFNEEGELQRTMWMSASVQNKYSKNPIWRYKITTYDTEVFDWLARYGGDLQKTIDMVNKLAKIIKCGKKLLKEGYVYDIVMMREITRRVVTSITDNPMAVLAASAVD